jgi:hypothetical protein
MCIRDRNNGYGHLRNFRGNDSEALDCYLSPSFINDATATPSTIYLVNQLHNKTGEFDEEKLLLGYENIEHAKSAYLQEMTPQHFGGIRELRPHEIDRYHKRHKEGGRFKLLQNMPTELSNPASQLDG